MKYDFITVLDRTGADSIAANIDPWGVSPAPAQRIPMWIADMSFPTAPPILEAMHKRLAFPNFGYFSMPDEYFDCILRWQETRNGLTGLKRADIGYENGVLGGVSSAVQALTVPGEAVLLHAPAYIGFTHVLDNLGRKAELSPLRRDENGVWRMDYEDMERKLATREVHAAILCSPHNPTGRVWERWELERAMGLFRKYDVYVISDEIWSDIVLGGSVHIPTQSVSDDARMRTVALYAPSKTFNIAGLIGSYRVVYNPWLQARLAKQASLSHYNMQNVLSMHALLGAYSDEGAAWVDELREVLGRNARIASEFFEEIAGVDFARPQGTYMLFLDCDGWCAAHGMDIDELLRSGVEVGVLWQDGRPFGGDKTIRINLALPTARLREALERLAAYVFVR